MAKYGDLCRVEVSQSVNANGVVLAEFIETNSDGDSFFRCVSESDGVRGDDIFADYYQEIYSWEVIPESRAIEMNLGNGI